MIAALGHEIRSLDLEIAAGRTRSLIAEAACAIARVVGAAGIVLLTDVPGVLDASRQLIQELDAAQIESLIADGTLTVRLEASEFVDAGQCAQASCEILLHYDTVPVDCDANGRPDNCDIALGAQDQDADALLDECEYARGDFDLDGTVGGADLAVLLSLWGVVNAPFGDLNGDGQIAGADLSILLGNWGPY